MMSLFACRILKYQPLLWNLCAAAGGCFAFMRGFRLVSLGMEEADAASSIPYGRQMVWDRVAQLLMRSIGRVSLHWLKPAPLILSVESVEMDAAKQALTI